MKFKVGDWVRIKKPVFSAPKSPGIVHSFSGLDGIYCTFPNQDGLWRVPLSNLELDEVTANQQKLKELLKVGT